MILHEWVDSPFCKSVSLVHSIPREWCVKQCYYSRKFRMNVLLVCSFPLFKVQYLLNLWTPV